MKVPAEYDFQISQKPGGDIGPADYLSKPVLNKYSVLVMGIEKDLQRVSSYLNRF